MNLDKIFCADLESDGLLEEATKIHVLSYGFKNDRNEWLVDATNNYEHIKKLFSNENNVIAIHNGQRFDAPLVEKILGIKVKATVIDTLALAWYIDFGKPWNHYGLEWYGESFGVPKPHVNADEWKGLSEEELSIIKFYEQEIQ